ncbi:MAG: hypothetical protein WAT79_10090 [Saprospiraceae bacterium]
MNKKIYCKLLLLSPFFILQSCDNPPAEKPAKPVSVVVPQIEKISTIRDSSEIKILTIDSEDYRKRMLALAHDSMTRHWPDEGPLPLFGAILPFHRVVAYYGNFYSRYMGILGELPEDQLIHQLNSEVEKWEIADVNTPVIPAIHYIAITAQSNPGKGNTYRLRMPENQILKAITLSRKIDGICFLDIQMGHSTVERELPTLEKYLIEKDVHLGLDPEWSMKDGTIPGKKIGTLDASDINYAVDFLSELVKKHHLPPKILVVHRFTKGMLTNSDRIKVTPEVQIVINMDGFGFEAKKRDSYKRSVSHFPVQFTGFKLFYKNDIKSKPFRMMTPEEILELYPKPIYIQYQ